MKCRWLRWVGLLLLLEGILWLCGVWRFCADFPGTLDRSRPLLIQGRHNFGVQLVSQGNESVYLVRPDEVEKLGAVLKHSVPSAGALRTREGQLLDSHGRVLLDGIDENSVYAYSPKHDLLVWGTPPGASPYGLNIRYQGKTKFIRTWSINAVQIRPDGAIWLAEYRLQCGIAVLNPKGEFKGWRAFGYDERFVGEFAEVNDADMPQLKRLLARYLGEEKREVYR